MKKKKNKKYYLITSSNGYRHGAFPYTPEGLAQANTLISKLKKSHKENFEIEEK
jgi:hypothetical protein